MDRYHYISIWNHVHLLVIKPILISWKWLLSRHDHDEQISLGLLPLRTGYFWHPSPIIIRWSLSITWEMLYRIEIVLWLCSDLLGRMIHTLILIKITISPGYEHFLMRSWFVLRQINQEEVCCIDVGLIKPKEGREEARSHLTVDFSTRLRRWPPLPPREKVAYEKARSHLTILLWVWLVPGSSETYKTGSITSINSVWAHPSQLIMVYCASYVRSGYFLVSSILPHLENITGIAINQMKRQEYRDLCKMNVPWEMKTEDIQNTSSPTVIKVTKALIKLRAETQHGFECSFKYALNCDSICPATHPLDLVFVFFLVLSGFGIIWMLGDRLFGAGDSKVTMKRESSGLWTITGLPKTQILVEEQTSGYNQLYWWNLYSIIK